MIQGYHLKGLYNDLKVEDINERESLGAKGYMIVFSQVYQNFRIFNLTLYYPFGVSRVVGKTSMDFRADSVESLFTCGYHTHLSH